MLAQHEGAIQMAKTEQAEGENPAAKSLAGQIIRKRRAERAPSAPRTPVELNGVVAGSPRTEAEALPALVDPDLLESRRGQATVQRVRVNHHQRVRAVD